MQIFHKTRIPFRGKPAFVLSHYLLLYFFRYSVSHLMTYHLIFISGTIIRTFLVITAHKTIIFILIQIDITVIFVALFIICIVCTVFRSWFPFIFILLSLQESISPCCSPDYITKKRKNSITEILPLFYISEHSVHSLIFVKHLRMVLLFHLDICQKLPHTTVFKSKNIRVVFSGNQLFCSDTVCCKKSIVFLIL